MAVELLRNDIGAALYEYWHATELSVSNQTTCNRVFISHFPCYLDRTVAKRSFALVGYKSTLVLSESKTWPFDCEASATDICARTSTQPDAASLCQQLETAVAG